jgi:hypothetical protein
MVSPKIFESAPAFCKARVITDKFISFTLSVNNKNVCFDNGYASWWVSSRHRLNHPFNMPDERNFDHAAAQLSQKHYTTCSVLSLKQLSIFLCSLPLFLVSLSSKHSEAPIRPYCIRSNVTEYILTHVSSHADIPTDVSSDRYIN